MDERGWLFFALCTFFSFVGISYMRESKLVFLIEKYSSQLENLQNVTLPPALAKQLTENLITAKSISPQMNIGKPINQPG